MIYATIKGEPVPQQPVSYEDIEAMTGAEFLRFMAQLFSGGALLANVIETRLMSIAATCEAIEEASE